MRSLVHLGLLLALVVPTPALAADGVLEINQTCAEKTGCFSGDAAGFPVTIDGSAGKSYRLTSSLKLPDGNTAGIVLTSTVSVSASGTTIDLAGFTIGCFPGICPAGSGSGIFTSPFAAVPTTSVRVRNGTVQGTGDGIYLGSLSVVEDVNAIGNRGFGVRVGDYSTVSTTRAVQNNVDLGAGGIGAGLSATISLCTAALNHGPGIAVGAGSTVSGNTAYGNVSAGDGMTAGPGSTVSGNTAYGNAGDGIDCGSACTVKSNTVVSNASYGLRLGAQSGYRENVISGNTTGTVAGAAIVNLGNNACNGTTTCP